MNYEFRIERTTMEDRRSSYKSRTRFQCMDNQHIQALKELFEEYPVLDKRMEFHMPAANIAKGVFSSNSAWVWPKLERRPVAYLVFIESFAPCIWNPSRQEGCTLQWILTPNFYQNGPVVCLANLIQGESILQIEDVVVMDGKDLWSSVSFSKRWECLRELFRKIPSDQPLLTLKTQVVVPLSLEKWSESYDSSFSWIIQPDIAGRQRWFWKDSTVPKERPSEEIVKTHIQTRTAPLHQNTALCANCRPYTKLNLPDTYALYSQDEEFIGLAGVSGLELSRTLKAGIVANPVGFPVEISWNPDFEKYQITKIMAEGSIVSPFSFFSNVSTG